MCVLSGICWVEAGMLLNASECTECLHKKNNYPDKHTDNAKFQNPAICWGWGVCPNLNCLGQGNIFCEKRKLK